MMVIIKEMMRMEMIKLKVWEAIMMLLIKEIVMKELMMFELKIVGIIKWKVLEVDFCKIRVMMIVEIEVGIL